MTTASLLRALPGNEAKVSPGNEAKASPGNEAINDHISQSRQVTVSSKPHPAHWGSGLPRAGGPKSMF